MRELASSFCKVTGGVQQCDVLCRCYAEMAQGGRPLFPGSATQDQLMRIFKLLGTPTEQTWFGCTELPEWHVCRLPRQRTFAPALPLADFGRCFFVREIWAPTFFYGSACCP
jgi:hypothetical protein